MVEDDVQLIHRVLAGDDEAFTTLVRKHQKGVHALAWRKIGDFHFAEEITQDVFLRAYKHLSKLKDAKQFSGWLYVITDRLCNTWLRKSKPTTESLEDISVGEMERMSYEQYLSAEQEAEDRAHRYERVRRLLDKLPESERTVMTLYYLGEMTAKEISKFLGVSVNTITSRLQRARKRLKQDEEILVQELLGSIQLSESLTQKIAQKVADTKVTPSSTGKPLLPWAAFGAAAVLVTLFLLGLSNQYLVRFQRPYSFEAQSEPTIEIVDTPIVLDIDTKPAVRNQTGRAVTTNRNNGTGAQTTDSDLASNTQEGPLRLSTSQWAQAAGPQGGSVFDVFAAADGTIYAFSQTGIYRLRPEAPAWTLINNSVPIEGFPVPMTEHAGILYIVSNDKIFASTTDGETWKPLGSRPQGHAAGLVIVNEAQGNNSHVHPTMYLALRDEGIFRSTDVSGQWTLLGDGLMGRKISAVVAIGDMVFAGTDEGLYRLDSGAWERLLEGVSGYIHSLAVAEGRLYVGTGPDFLALQQMGSKSTEVMQTMYNGNSSLNRVFHSADLGTSWREITPIRSSLPIRARSGMSLLVAGKTVLAQSTTRFRSRDGGQTWADLGFDMDSFVLSGFPSAVGNENTFYRAGPSGIHRTTDGGESWHLFMDGIVGTGILDLVAVNNRLYARTKGGIVQSTDGGESWRAIRTVANGAEQPHLNLSSNSQLTIAGNTLYGISPEAEALRVFRLSADGNQGFTPVEGIPTFEVDVSPIGMLTDSEEAQPVHASEGHEKADTPLDTLRRKEHERIGAFAVSGETFYVEYKPKLFKWEPGDAAWKETGLIDTGTPTDETLNSGFKLAVSGDTVYVGKRDGKLFQSLDRGNSWKDITSTLPRPFTAFTEIVFAGSTVYVGTDTGVLASQTGSHWRVITDAVTIDRFAVDGTTLYGAGDTGVYHLDMDGDWKQVSPGVPGKVLSLVVDRDRLYVATERRGMFHISLAEERDTVSRR